MSSSHPQRDQDNLMAREGEAGPWVPGSYFNFFAHSDQVYHLHCSVVGLRHPLSGPGGNTMPFPLRSRLCPASSSLTSRPPSFQWGWLARAGHRETALGSEPELRFVSLLEELEKQKGEKHQVWIQLWRWLLWVRNFGYIRETGKASDGESEAQRISWDRKCTHGDGDRKTPRDQER